MASSSTPNSNEGGIPFGLKIVMGIAGIVLLILVVVQLIPADPLKHYEAALQAFEDKDGDRMLYEYELFSQYDGYEKEKRLVEGMKWVVDSRPLKAIPLLKAAMDDEETRDDAMLHLGRAYRNAEMYSEAVAILEQAIEEEANVLKARSLLVNIYHDIGAMDKVVETADYLIDKNTELQTAYRARGEVLRKRGLHAEAAADLEAALLAEPPNFMSSAIGTSLLRSYLEAGEFQKAMEYRDLASSEPAKNLMDAQVLLGEGKADEAYDAIRKTVSDMGAEPQAYVTLARTVLAAKPEMADEALEMIRSELEYMNRSADLYDAMSDLATLIDDQEIAELYRQNRDRLKEIEGEYLNRVRGKSAGIDDPKWRLEMGDLAAELRLFEVARYWYDAAVKLDHDLENEADAKTAELYETKPELVPTLGLRGPKEEGDSEAAPSEQNTGSDSSVDASSEPVNPDAGDDKSETPASGDDQN